MAYGKRCLRTDNLCSVFSVLTPLRDDNFIDALPSDSLIVKLLIVTKVNGIEITDWATLRFALLLRPR